MDVLRQERVVNLNVSVAVDDFVETLYCGFSSSTSISLNTR